MIVCDACMCSDVVCDGRIQWLCDSNECIMQQAGVINRERVREGELVRSNE